MKFIRNLDPEEMAELVRLLYQEADAEYQRGNHYYAGIRYAQCLNMLNLVDPNLINVSFVISTVLFELGTIYTNVPEQAQAFFEASIYIKLQRGNQEIVGDYLVETGQAMAELKFYIKAKSLFEKALSIYLIIRLTGKADAVRKKIRELEAKISKEMVIEGRNKSHQFDIFVNKVPVKRLVVTTGGETHWTVIKGINIKVEKPLLLGSDPTWKVFCTDNQ